MTSAQYQQRFDHYVGQGYRLADVDGDEQNGQARYTAIWQKRRDGGTWQARHGMTPAGYQQTFNQLKAHGYRPVRVSAYNVGGQVRFATIWVESGSTH